MKIAGAKLTLGSVILNALSVTSILGSVISSA